MEQHPAYQALVAAYTLHVGDKPRATRHLPLLQHLLRDASTMQGAEQITQTLSDELHACEILQHRLGADGIDQAQREESIASLQHVYKRHFSGQRRQTRDLFFLEDLITRMQTLQGPWQSWRQEYMAIQHAYNETPNAQRIGLLGACANDTFYAFESYIAGLRPITCRPSLLQRLIKRLKSIEAETRALAPLFPQQAQTNLRVINDHLSNWEELADHVRMLRSQASQSDIMAALAEHLDQLLDVSTQHEGTQAAWGQLCDRADELVQQVEVLCQHDQDRILLAACRDARMEWENQYDATPSSQGHPSCSNA